MDDNDMTIFSYLIPSNNDKLSNLNDNDLKEILLCMNKYYLEYRNMLGISSDITFGMEIEMEHFRGGVEDFWPFEVAINQIVSNNDWVIKNDITLNWGRELATEIYTDNLKTWRDMKNVCEFASKYGEIDIKCAGHVNIGSQIFGNNTLYWYRFLKLWGTYENVIYRFGYGEYLNYFPFILYSAKPLARLIFDKKDILEKKINSSVISLLSELKIPGMMIDFLKKNAVSFFAMYDFGDYNVRQNGSRVEIRNCLGTLDEVIWQNYINFFIKMMLYCKSENFDDDILNRIIIQIEGILSNICEYNKIYLDQAIEFSDMIFDNNLDKIYFLRQYLKSFEIGDKPLIKTKKFTVTDNR